MMIKREYGLEIVKVFVFLVWFWFSEGSNKQKGGVAVKKKEEIFRIRLEGSVGGNKQLERDSDINVNLSTWHFLGRIREAHLVLSLFFPLHVWFKYL